MPGTLHQGLLLLLQEDPWLAFDVLGVEHPTEALPIDRRAEVERAGDQGSVLLGYPDLVLVARDPGAGAVIAIEVQKHHDPSKRYMIPVYQGHLAQQHQLDTWVVVVSLSRTFSRALGRWARGGPPQVDVLLLDAETVSRSWLDVAESRPTAAVLTGVLHGYAGDIDAARVGFQAARAMTDERRAHRHGMTVLAALPKHLRDQLIGELPMNEQHSWMDVERRSGTFAFGREEGRAEGLERGRAEGLEQGREQGLERGREALLGLICKLLADRGVEVDAASEVRLRGCQDLAQLQAWVLQAMHVSRVDELFGS